MHFRQRSSELKWGAAEMLVSASCPMSRGSDGARRRRRECRGGGQNYLAAVSSEIITASVQTMSTLSPTFTFDSASLSCTLELYFQLFGPLKVIDGTFMSIAVIVAVMVRWVAAVPPGLAVEPAVTAAVSVSTSFSPGCFTRTTTLS